MSITIDRGSDIPVYSPVCLRCKHYRPNSDGEGRQCAAFPVTDSIPLVIWKGENPHTTPFPEDHGIQFLPLPGAE